MTTITLFTWGYYGWGNATQQLVQWALPVLFLFFDPATRLAAYEKETDKLRQEWGLEPVSHGNKN